MQVASDGSHDDLSRVQAHPDLNRNAIGPADAVGVPLHRFQHPQPRVARADSMVLVGKRRAEQRHDPVPHHLIDGAFVAVDGLHHVFEHRVEEPAGVLRVAVREELHRPPEVGEENGHLLALAFEGGLRGQDLFSEMFRSVRVWGSELGSRSCPQGCGALAAELIPGRVGRTTGRTR